MKKTDAFAASLADSLSSFGLGPKPANSGPMNMMGKARGEKKEKEKNARRRARALLPATHRAPSRGGRRHALALARSCAMGLEFGLGERQDGDTGIGGCGAPARGAAR